MSTLCSVGEYLLWLVAEMAQNRKVVLWVVDEGGVAHGGDKDVLAEEGEPASQQVAVDSENHYVSYAEARLGC